MKTRSHPIRVLLVGADEDDYLLIRDLLSNISPQQYMLDRAIDHDAACDALNRGDHDVCLFAPCLSSKRDGDFVGKMDLECPNLPIILLVDSGDHSIAMEAIGAGVADSITKDEIDAGLLERSIRYAIELTAAKRALQRTRDQLETRPGGGQGETLQK